jgi:NAD(P)H-flavin reductase
MDISHNKNPMLPFPGKLIQVKDLANEIKLFSVSLLDDSPGLFTDHKPGQFAFLSAFGAGEAPFGIASTNNQNHVLEFAVQRLGSVTTRLHELGEGDIVGVRGPMGNFFPLDEIKGKNLVVIGGGIGGAPLRPVIQTVLADRHNFGHMSILWAARHPSLLVFTDEYEEWRLAPNTELHLTVDTPDKSWDHNVGLITELLERVSPAADNTFAITCGPPIMLYYVDQVLTKLGFKPQQCYVTLEARMHCGLGICGRCNLSEKLMCVDGPVFSMDQVSHLMEKYYC